MSTNNMENPNGEGSDRKKRYWPERDAFKNEDRPQSKVHEVQLVAAYSDEDLTKVMGDFRMKGVKPDSPEKQRLGPLIRNFEESVTRHNPPVPNKQGHCSRGDVSMHQHAAQLNMNLAKLETDSLRRYIKHFKIEGINPDSSREQMLHAVQQHFASQPPLDKQQVIPEFIDAARGPKNKGKSKVREL